VLSLELLVAGATDSTAGASAGASSAGASSGANKNDVMEGTDITTASKDDCCSWCRNGSKLLRIASNGSRARECWSMSSNDVAAGW
jgi:hypothetical protein